MRIIDLTHTVAPGMPLFPGTPQPQLEAICTHERDGFRETRLALTSHVGTHVDAPAHVLPGGRTLDVLDASAFVGSALVVDCRGLGEGARIEIERVERMRPAADGVDFLLFDTGWSEYWGSDAYFGPYPCLSEAVVDYALRTGKKGIGLDTAGIDPVESLEMPLHRRFFSRGGTLIVENLTNLKNLGAEAFTLAVLPLKYADADGAPARAVAILLG